MVAQRIQRLSFAVTIGVAVLLVGGAVTLKLTEADQHATWWELSTLFRSEYFHVPAHVLLYGTLTAGMYGILGGRWRRVLVAVFVVGWIQEAAQSLLFGRAMGNGEVFDLGVDLAAACLVLTTLHYGRRTFNKPSRVALSERNKR